MSEDRLLVNGSALAPYTYSKEAEFEREVVAHAAHIFGPASLYLDVKRRIGRDKVLTIPDGYLLDFTFPDAPRLYIVENELSTHDAFRHIGQQLLKFAVSYKASGRTIKAALLKEILADEGRAAFVDAQVARCGFRNVDALLEHVVYEAEVGCVVVIDRVTPELDNVLGQLTMKTDVLEFATYSDGDRRVHRFTQFHEDIVASAPAPSKDATPDPTALDTVVVPARPEGFESCYLGEARWRAIRMSAAMVGRVRYCAAYQVAPISAVTHVAEVVRIEKYRDTGKYELVFDGPPREVGPVELGNQSALAPQAPRYTTYDRLIRAKTLRDVF